MEAIFAAITQAHEVLVSAELRQKYDQKLTALGPRPAAAPAPAAPVDPRVAAKREEAALALKQRYAEAKAKAREHANRGSVARAAGDFVGAEDAYRTALNFTPSDPALKAAYEEVRDAAAARLTDAHVKQALLEERYGHWGEAAASWERVLAERPNDKDALEHLAKVRSKAPTRG
jgi:tetratricopeptide (TPR) repeat protein